MVIDRQLDWSSKKNNFVMYLNESSNGYESRSSELSFISQLFVGGIYDFTHCIKNLVNKIATVNTVFLDSYKKKGGSG